MPNRRFEDRKEFLSRLAMDTATACPHKVFGTIKVFYIGNGWHTDWIKKEDNISKSKTIKEFEAALSNPAIKTIFIEEDKFIPLQAMQYFCSRSNQSKIVFVEGDIDG